MGMPKVIKEKPKFQKPAGPAGAKVRHTPKNFSVANMNEESTEGKKIIIYANTGMGKSTLASMAPDAVFFCPDKGLGDLAHPKGESFSLVPGIDTFADVRDAIQQGEDLVPEGGTAVLDTITYIQGLCGDWCVKNIKKEKGGYAKSITTYGYGKGYEHVYNQLRLLQADCDKLLATGRNVIVLAQLAKHLETDTTYGEYWFSHPDLYDKGNSPCIALWVAWASYVFKIGWGSIEIDDGKIGVSSDERAVFVKPEFSFEAKSRGSLFDDTPVVTFNEKSDDSLWRFMFDGD